MDRLAARDERETLVDHAADRVAYLALSFGLLALVAYRSFVNGEKSWDLLALVVLGGLIGTAYRAQQRVISRRWAVMMAIGAAVGLILAAVMVMVRPQ